MRVEATVLTCHAEVVATPEQFFSGSPAGLALYQAVAEAIQVLGPVQVRVSASQISFRRRKGFAFLWRPGRYVASDVPAVLSFGLPEELHSPRVKQVAHPAARVWMHHVELWEPSQVDDEIGTWLAAAYRNAA